MSDKQYVIRQLALYGITNHKTVEKIVKEIADKYKDYFRNSYTVAREHLDEWFNDTEDKLAKSFAMYGVTDPEKIAKCKAEILERVPDSDKQETPDPIRLILKYMPQYFEK